MVYSYLKPNALYINLKFNLKPSANGHNVVGPQLLTLLVVTFCLLLHALLDIVACYRSVAQQCWIRLHSSSLTAHPKLLVPRTRIKRGLQSLMGCIFSIIHCSSKQWWKLLHPFASVRNLVTEKQLKVQLK